MGPAQELGQWVIDRDDDVDGKESRAAGWRLTVNSFPEVRNRKGTESGLHGGHIYIQCEPCHSVSFRPLAFVKE